MCGIVGIVGGGVPRKQVLVRMAEAMAHRGPDGQGTWRDDHAGLAFRRLAVIDLDRRSGQPLHLGPWHLVFDGEIYNYRELRAELERLGHAFVTEGDGEVLLHAWAQWEERALPRLRDGLRKAVLRDAVRDVVPASVLARRDKVGFEPPQDAWLADEGVRARMAEVLLDPGARTAPLVDRGTLEADVAAGRWRDARAAWRVFNLELWLRGVERPAPEPVAATV